MMKRCRRAAPSIRCGMWQHIGSNGSKPVTPISPEIASIGFGVGLLILIFITGAIINNNMYDDDYFDDECLA